MSLASIRSILEGQLASISPAVSTAYENAPFTPVAGTAFQQATLLPAEPENREIGPAYTERGIFAVNLFYPKDKGSKDALARGAAIREKFKYGASFSGGGVTVNIIGTPEIGPARAEDDRFMVPVRIRWHSRINGG